MRCDNCCGQGQRESWRYPATDNFGDSDGERPKFLGYVECEECGGTGKTPEDKMVPCPVCHGQNFIHLNNLHKDYQPVCWTNFSCPACDGEGRVKKDFSFGFEFRLRDEGIKIHELKILLLKLLGGNIKP